MSSKNTSSQAKAFDRAAALLRAGELVAFPTDTVYGVGAVCWNETAVGMLYTAKLRALDKAIPILIADLSDLMLVATELPPMCRRLAQRFWPGPLTLVVPKAPRVPLAVTAGGDTVAVRLPNLALARELIRAAGAPLATTSANLSGRTAPVRAEEVAAQLGRSIALILDGGSCPGGSPSTIVDATGSELRILRAGPITSEQMQAVL